MVAEVLKSSADNVRHLPTATLSTLNNQLLLNTLNCCCQQVMQKFFLIYTKNFLQLLFGLTGRAAAEDLVGTYVCYLKDK